MATTTASNVVTTAIAANKGSGGYDQIGRGPEDR